eukprot:3404937-Prymnesium_polylepis.1
MCWASWSSVYNSCSAPSLGTAMRVSQRKPCSFADLLCVHSPVECDCASGVSCGEGRLIKVGHLDLQEQGRDSRALQIGQEGICVRSRREVPHRRLRDEDVGAQLAEVDRRVEKPPPRRRRWRRLLKHAFRAADRRVRHVHSDVLLHLEVVQKQVAEQSGADAIICHCRALE